MFGIYAPGGEGARLSFFGVFAQQHRGQESAGIAASDGLDIRCHTGLGLVSQVFNEDILGRLRGHIAIGHNRYSTKGSNTSVNAQPVMVRGPLGELALAHNGNIVNYRTLSRDLLGKGCTFTSSTDSEVIARLIALGPGRTWVDKIRHAMRRLEGAYSLTLLTQDSLMAVRDPLGVRPLCLGSLDGGWVVASESCALDHIGAQFLREVEPGEIVVIDQHGVSSFREPSPRKALCIFEYIYFARPDSVIEKRLLYQARADMGAELSREYPVDADLVLGVPDSATEAAIGYAAASGIPFAEGVIKNRYVGRTFIQPDQRLRELGVKLKFNPLPEVLRGKRVVVLDDSIVRGTTTPHIVSMLRRAGAREVHLRICAPPIRFPCFFGVDMATRRELIAAFKSVADVRCFIGADSLGYLSLNGLIKAIGLCEGDFCLACFTGNYPVPVQLELGAGEGMDKLALEV